DALRKELGRDFEYGHDANKLAAHSNAYAQLNALLSRRGLFDIAKLPAKRVIPYGNTPLGRDCLLACQLVEQGVPFVTIQSPKLEWDMHFGADTKQRQLNEKFDSAVGSMIDDLIARGLWQHTLVVLMGEFGRSPSISSEKGGGRDHWSDCW